MNRPDRHPWTGPEWPFLLAISVVAAGLRLYDLGRLGLDHFDEGIYASTGAWSLRPERLSGIDPGLIAYAPPGYPILVGVSYALLGASDLAAILVSILAGVATIPVMAWLGRRTFGPPFGIAAAGFAAGSGMHVTFSRMALTDATFLLTWLVAIGLAGRFLDRPGPGRAVALGLSVGLAQLVKYNGWLLGAIVAASALLGPFVSPMERTQARLVRTFGWGGLAAIVAAIVYWPWFGFVDRHGGYSSLLAHQRSYLGNASSWPAHWLTQLRQVVVLSGGHFASRLGGVLATGGILGSILRSRAVLPRLWSPVMSALLLVLLIGPGSGWWFGLGLAAFFLAAPDPAVRLLAVWWILLSILTPIYHPYARLWLPLEAAGWLMSVSVVGAVFGWSNGPGGSPDLSRVRKGGIRFAVLAVCYLASLLVPAFIPPRARSLPDPASGPRDSFRTAVARAVSKVPAGVRAVGFLGRPTLAFYASGPLAQRGIASQRLGSLDDLWKQVEGWAIVDAVQVRQEGDADRARARLLERWTLVAEEPTTLSNATLLDVDPGAAVGDLSARIGPILLLRPRREGANP